MPTPSVTSNPDAQALSAQLLPLLSRWYTKNARTLPWRTSGTSPYGIFVCEMMSHQTPVARVWPRWEAWLERWPDFEALASASPAEVLRMWERLGYPRRSLWLHQSAQVVVRNFAGKLPSDPEVLRTLPGVGHYTAAAVVSFAFGQRIPVLDTNIRRVIARACRGIGAVASHMNTEERDYASALLPISPKDSVTWNMALMELGALVCTSGENPTCEVCPLRTHCEWLAAGKPASTVKKRTQTWEGTDRQMRGRLMAVLREAHEAVPHSQLIDQALSDSALGNKNLEDAAAQAERALASLQVDGLIEAVGADLLRLPLS